MTGVAREAARISPADLQPREARQVDVEDHQRRRLALEGLEGGGAVPRLDHHVAGLAQGVADQARAAPGRRPPPGSSCRRLLPSAARAAGRPACASPGRRSRHAPRWCRRAARRSSARSRARAPCRPSPAPPRRPRRAARSGRRAAPPRRRPATPGPSSSTQRAIRAASTAPPIAHHRAGRRELVGVGEQVDEHLGQARRVAADRRQRIGELDLHLLAALGEERRRHLDRLLDHLVEGHRPAADRVLAGLDAHALQQVVDELGQPQAAALQRQDEVVGLAGRGRRDPGAGARAAARSRRAGRRAGCGTRARCWPARRRAGGGRPRRRSRRAAPGTAGPRWAGRW